MGYPSEAERRRLERFPDRIEVEDLRSCFALSDADRELVFAQRGAANRLGLAVALCAVRLLGFVPDDIASIPDEALAFVAGQVDPLRAAGHALEALGRRMTAQQLRHREPARRHPLLLVLLHVLLIERGDELLDQVDRLLRLGDWRARRRV